VQNARSSCTISTKVGMSQHILVKLASVKFNENLIGGSQVNTFGQTEI
jgi:hypothetical protein